MTIGKTLLGQRCQQPQTRKKNLWGGHICLSARFPIYLKNFPPKDTIPSLEFLNRLTPLGLGIISKRHFIYTKKHNGY